MRHYLRVGNRTHLRSFGRGLLRPLATLQAYEAAAIVDGATRAQPELGELTAARAVDTTAARTTLGSSYRAAAERGAAMTDDELVTYLDRTMTALGVVATSSVARSYVVGWPPGS